MKSKVGLIALLSASLLTGCGTPLTTALNPFSPEWSMNGAAKPPTAAATTSTSPNGTGWVASGMVAAGNAAVPVLKTPAELFKGVVINPVDYHDFYKIHVAYMNACKDPQVARKGANYSEEAIQAYKNCLKLADSETVRVYKPITEAERKELMRKTGKWVW